MLPFLDPQHRPRLLVSVRNATEALAAFEGGAHVIDIKEPARGSLGAADNATINEVLQTIHGRAPVTAAAGELVELAQTSPPPLPPGLALFKIGLAHCTTLNDWHSHWHSAMNALWPGAHSAHHTVAVVYADWRTAAAPPPSDVLQAAVEAGCPALLIDTFNKSAGGLFDHWPLRELDIFLRTARTHKLAVVLAGSLVGQHITTAAKLEPDLIAVRTAACDNNRSGPVSKQRVANLIHAISKI